MSLADRPRRYPGQTMKRELVDYRGTRFAIASHPAAAQSRDTISSNARLRRRAASRRCARVKSLKITAKRK